MSHICPTDDRLAPQAKWCPTLGVCDQWRRADPAGAAGPCRGLLCEHGCQRGDSHITPAGAAHAALVAGFTAAGYIRRLRDVLDTTASTNLAPWPCANKPGEPGFCLCCTPPPDPPFNVIRHASPPGPFPSTPAPGAGGLHAAPPLGSAAREATASPYHGRRRDDS